MDVRGRFSPSAVDGVALLSETPATAGVSLEDSSEPPWEVTIPLGDEFGTYWEFADAHRCEPYDPIAGPGDDPNGVVLHVSVAFEARRGADAEITITP